VSEYNIEKLLAYNPEDRPSAKEALRHPYFKDLYEKDKQSQHAANLGSSYMRATPQLR